MDLGDHLLVGLAAFCAGAVNGVAGGGSLISFPALVATGLTPVAASITNTLGLMPGYVGSAHAYLGELSDQRDRARQLIAPAALGAVAGATFLLVGPAAVFETIVPFLILAAAAMLVAQPVLQRRLAQRSSADQRSPAALLIVTCLAGAYGAYFGGALGVILLAALGTALAEDLQRVNALKNLLSVVINAVAVGIFVFSAQVHWSVVAVMGVGSLLGGRLGVGVARRVGARTLRRMVVLIAAAAAVALIVRR